MPFSTALNTSPTAFSCYCHETIKANFGVAENDWMMANPVKTKIPIFLMSQV
jgi:hypothetical protein